MGCNCLVCTDDSHGTMDPISPNNVHSSITGLSESPSRNYANPYANGNSGCSLYHGKQNLCPKTDMSRNRRVRSMTVGSTSNSGPNLSASATDESSKATTFLGQRIDQDDVDISDHDRSILADMETRVKMLFKEAAEMDRTIEAQRARRPNHLYAHEIDEQVMTDKKKKKEKKKTLFRDTTDDGSILPERNPGNLSRQATVPRRETIELTTEERERQKNAIYKASQRVQLLKKALFGDAEDRKRESSVWGCSPEDALILEDIKRRPLFDGRTKNTLIGDVLDNPSMAEEINN